MYNYLKMIPVISFLLLTACTMPRISLFPGGGNPLEEYALEGKGKQKILVIPVQGQITDSAEKGLLRSKPGTVQQVVSQLRKAEKDGNIKGLILKVDSPGGTVTASDILYHEISEYKRKTGVKVLAMLMNVAASGGYYISLPADRIMAHPTSITGSVGVIILRPEVSGLMDRLGIRVSVSKTGEQKDMGSPFRKSGPEEDRLFRELAEDMGKRFLSLVQKHRNPDADALRQIATARVFLAGKALKLGLVDDIGYLDDAVKKTAELAGIGDDFQLIFYRRTEYPDDNIYNAAAESQSGLTALMNAEIPLSLPAAGFYYLWPPASGN